MKKLYTLLIIPFLLGFVTPEPPKIEDKSTYEYVKTLRNNLNKPQVVTTLPNGNVNGEYGELITYSNSVDFSLYVNTSSPEGTSWTQIGAIPPVTPTTPTKFKVINIPRDLSTASGSVAYTGVGFTPQMVVFIGGFNSAGAGTGLMSVGVDDGTTSGSNVLIPGGGTINPAGGKSIYFSTDGSNAQTASISAFGADGFTLDWVKTNSPTGTVYITALCIG